MKRIVVFILALTMIFSASSISFAADSYTAYFSEEREFIVNDDTYNWSTYFYSDKENGYLYSRNVDTEEIKLIYAQNVTEHYLYGDNLYCVVNGKNLVKITVTGENPQTILNTSKDIEQFYANDDIIFYLMDNTIYRYHILSKTTDVMVSDDEINFFYPYSSATIEWGDRNEEQEIKRIDGRTRGITTVDRYTFLNDNTSTRAAASVRVHGTYLPYGSYTAEKYYNTSTLNPCTCHRSDGQCNNVLNNIDCGSCMHYSGGGKSGWQCIGFAYMIYNQIWGSHPAKNTSTHDISTTALAREAFWDIPSGTHVRLITADGGKHSIIVADVTTTGIVSYEANWEAGCGISYETLSFSTLASRYDSIYFTYDGQHTIASGYMSNSSMHWRKCISSTCNGKINLGYHTYVANAQGNMVCSVCNYVSDVSVNSIEDDILS